MYICVMNLIRVRVRVRVWDRISVSVRGSGRGGGKGGGKGSGSCNVSGSGRISRDCIGFSFTLNPYT